MPIWNNPQDHSVIDNKVMELPVIYWGALGQTGIRLVSRIQIGEVGGLVGHQPFQDNISESQDNISESSLHCLTLVLPPSFLQNRERDIYIPVPAPLDFSSSPHNPSIDRHQPCLEFLPDLVLLSLLCAGKSPDGHTGKSRRGAQMFSSGRRRASLHCWCQLDANVKFVKFSTIWLQLKFNTVCRSCKGSLEMRLRG